LEEIASYYHILVNYAGDIVAYVCFSVFFFGGGGDVGDWTVLVLISILWFSTTALTCAYSE